RSSAGRGVMMSNSYTKTPCCRMSTTMAKFHSERVAIHDFVLQLVASELEVRNPTCGRMPDELGPGHRGVSLPCRSIASLRDRVRARSTRAQPPSPGGGDPEAGPRRPGPVRCAR